jgi:hypothetical protein
MRTDTIKDLEPFLDSRLRFHQQVPTLTDFVRVTSFPFVTANSLPMFYLTFVRSGLEYDPVAWNTFTYIDDSKIEDTQRKF